jgi:hypothetical protein
MCNANYANREKIKEADAANLKEHPDQEELTLHETSSRLKKWVQVSEYIQALTILQDSFQSR